jgi:Flp pilus assembly CpaE family ATPase
MNEEKIERIKSHAYSANKNLSVYTGDGYSQIKGVFRFIDGLRSVYDTCIIDTTEYDASTVEAVSISDTVLVLEEMALPSIIKSQNFLEEIKGSTNLKKFVLVINKYFESKYITSKDILHSHKERGIEFGGVFLIPSCQIVVEAQYANKHGVELEKDAFTQALNHLHDSLMGTTEEKPKGILRRLFK